MPSGSPGGMIAFSWFSVYFIYILSPLLHSFFFLIFLIIC